MSPAAKAREAVNGRTTTSARTSSRARLIDRRGGPRYGPPASSSEGGYAPIGLPRPSLGRAPAQPWRASGLTQDVSSNLHRILPDEQRDEPGEDREADDGADAVQAAPAAEQRRRPDDAASSLGASSRVLVGTITTSGNRTDAPGASPPADP